MCRRAEVIEKKRSSGFLEPHITTNVRSSTTSNVQGTMIKLPPPVVCMVSKGVWLITATDSHLSRMASWAVQAWVMFRSPGLVSGSAFETGRVSTRPNDDGKITVKMTLMIRRPAMQIYFVGFQGSEFSKEVCRSHVLGVWAPIRRHTMVPYPDVRRWNYAHIVAESTLKACSRDTCFSTSVCGAASEGGLRKRSVQKASGLSSTLDVSS